MRTFVAVSLPEELREALGRLVEGMRRSGADVRWVRPDSLHFTLKFLGQVDRERLGAIDRALRDAARRCAPTAARLRGVGTFPGLRRPRVVWVGVEDASGGLARAQAEVEAALQELGFPAEPRPFRPHVTLGRVRSPRGLPALVRAVAALERRDFGGFGVRRIELFESRLSPQGARYSRLASYRLGAGG